MILKEVGQPDDVKNTPRGGATIQKLVRTATTLA